MTTGSWTRNSQYVQATPTGGAGYVGRIRTKTWSGTDAVGPTKPRAAYKLLPRGPQKEALYLHWKYQWRKWRRELPPQPYTMTAEDRETGIISWRYKGEKTWRYGFLGSTDPWGGIIPPPDPVYEYRAIARLRKKVYGSGFNPAIFTVEGQMAIKMVGSAAQRLRLGIYSLLDLDLRGIFRNFRIPTDNYAHAKSVFYRYKRGRLVEGDSTLKAKEGVLTFSGALLELRYGWQPLIGDIERGAQFIGHAVGEGNFGYSRIKTRVKWEVRQQRPVGTNEVTFTERVLQYELSLMMRGVSKSPPYVPSIHTLTTAAWERLPWSFVFDWVVPVSGYLEACRTANDLKGEVVRSLKVTAVCSQASVRGGSNTQYGGVWMGSVHRKKVQFDRTVSTELNPPRPLSDVRDLGEFWEKFSLTLIQAQNAVALCAQLAYKPSIKDMIRMGRDPNLKYTD